MKQKFFAFVLGIGIAAVAQAQTTQATTQSSVSEASESQGNRTQTEQAKDNGLPFSIEGKIDTTTAYFYRGYRYQDSGYIVQPEITLSLNEIKAGGFGFTPYVTAFANVTEQTGDSSSWDHLNEVDVNPGVEVTWDKLPNFTFDFQYNTNFFPSSQNLVAQGQQGQLQEVGVTVKYDDSSLKLLPFALNPHISYYQELEDRGDDSHDSYVEVGIEPEFKVTEKLSFSVPLTLGGSIDSYYTKSNGQNDLFGYTSVGIHPKYQFAEHWDVHANFDYLYLLSDSVVEANSGDRNVFIGGVGLGFSY